MRKSLDDFLYWLLPNTWVPLYNTVSFTHMPYKKCIDNRAWQDRMLNNALKYGGVILTCITILGSIKLFKDYDIVNTAMNRFNEYIN